jgi:hypothetical protein
MWLAIIISVYLAVEVLSYLTYDETENTQIKNAKHSGALQ